MRLLRANRLKAELQTHVRYPPRQTPESLLKSACSISPSEFPVFEVKEYRQ